MKNFTVLALFVSVLFTFSCKNETKEPITESEVMDVIPDDEEVTVACYRFANDKDTILLNIENDFKKFKSEKINPT